MTLSESGWGRTRFDAEHELETARIALAAAEQRAAALTEAANMLANTVALMNSMILSGESHSPTSQQVMRESLDAYRAASSSAAQEGTDA